MAKNKSATEPKRSLIDQVLGSIDADAADLLRGYVALPLVSEELLAEQVDAYLVQLDEFTSDGEIVDMELALDIARWCIRMLEEIGDETPDDAARLIQAAVRYFVNFDDFGQRRRIADRPRRRRRGRRSGRSGDGPRARPRSRGLTGATAHDPVRWSELHCSFAPIGRTGSPYGDTPV